MSRFSELSQGLSRGVSELVNDSDNTYDPRSYDSMASRPFTVQRQDYDRETPPKDDMKKYWRQYETTPIVRKPINAFANRIVEPGYYLETPDEVDEEKIEELYQWLENAAFEAGEPEQDIRDLLKSAIIQREVRGTAIIEKVYAKEDRDVLMAVKMLNPETIEVNTRPGQAILLAPDDNEKEEWDPPLTPEGKAAGYLQDLSQTQVSWGRSEKIRRVGAGPDGDSRYPNRIGFTRDNIVKLERDNDVGDIFGTSRVESVSDRIDGLNQKLQDNDEAIASKAYPLWLFRFGVGEDATPWSREDINNFMQHHEMGEFHPGMKQGVRGDVEIETVSGEVANIAESLQFDLDWILSAMPMARQALGGFAGSAGGAAAEVSGMAQETNIVRQIKEVRRELEADFTPVIQQKARELDGVDEDLAEKFTFKVGDPNDESGSEDPSVSTSRIEYHGVGDDEDTDAPPEQLPPESEDDAPSGSDVGPFGDRRGVVQPDPSELQFPIERAQSRVSQLEQSDDELASLLEKTVLDVRETALDEIQQRYKDSPKSAAYNFPSSINRYIERATNRQLRREVKSIVEAELREVVHREYSVEHNNRVEMFTEDIVSACYEAMEDIASDMRVQLKRAAQDGDEWETVKARIENLYDDGTIASRAWIISQMELQNAREATKLSEFENADDIVGVRIHNPDSSTPVTQEAHGVEAYFDEGSIGDQIREQVPENLYRENFDPLPATPPYHFGDTTVLKPIYEEEDDD